MSWPFSRHVWLACPLVGLVLLATNRADEIPLPDKAVAADLAPGQPKPQRANDSKPAVDQAQTTPAQLEGPATSVAQLKPQWRPGQRWIVETITQQTQARDEQKPQQRPRPVRWEFRVVGVERIGDRDCFRVDVQCQVQGRTQPITSFWADQESLSLRQVQTQLPVQGKFRTITERYSSAAQQATPVFGPLTALPIDLPLFLAEQAKGATQFTYKTESVVEGAKAAEELGFAFQIEQQAKPADATQVKALVGEQFAKDFNKQPVMEIKLSGSGRQVRQLWQSSLPWPVFSENGSAEARLVEVLPPPSETQ